VGFPFSPRPVRPLPPRKCVVPCGRSHRRRVSALSYDPMPLSQLLRRQRVAISIPLGIQCQHLDLRLFWDRRFDGFPAHDARDPVSTSARTR
jgi:hypothetical protein